VSMRGPKREPLRGDAPQGSREKALDARRANFGCTKEKGGGEAARCRRERQTGSHQGWLKKRRRFSRVDNILRVRRIEARRVPEEM